MQTLAGSKLGNRPKRKLFLLAVDATDLQFVQSNLSSLPNFKQLFNRGRLIETKSSANLLSASPWTTFSSGMMPGEHGHYFPLQWDASAMRFYQVKGNALAFEPFWNGLASKGVKTIVFDAMSVPVDPTAPGIQVVNWNTQCNFTPTSNRQDVLRQLKQKFGRKPIGDEIAVRKSRKVLTRHRDKLIKSVRKKSDAIAWIMKEFEWDFFLTSYFEGHRAGHNLWPIWKDFTSDPPEGAMLDVYQELDVQIGRLLAALDFSDTVLLLFSLHGMVPGFAQDHFLPGIMDRVNFRYASNSGEVPQSQRRGIARILRQTIPASVQLRIRELVGQDIQDWLVDREWRGGKDWKRTPAFPVPCGGDVGFIRLNISGREKYGCLPASEEGRAPYVDFLCKSIRALRVKATNEPLVRDIVITEKEFPGPRSHLLPDILLVWHPDSPATEIWSEELGTITAHSKMGRGGVHGGDSFAVLAGAIDDDEVLPPLNHVVDYKNFVTRLLDA